MNSILPTSCDVEGFSKSGSDNYGWELVIQVSGKTMDELLERSVLRDMIKDEPVSEDFSWLSGHVKKHYIIDGFAQLNEIRKKLEEQDKYDSNVAEALEGDTSETSEYKFLLEDKKIVVDGTLEFYVTDKFGKKKQLIFIGFPIDLNTYLRIPRCFRESQKFLPIALFSPTQMGKSTLLASLLASLFPSGTKSGRRIANFPDEYKIEWGHWQNTGDYVYDWYKNLAGDMENGKCPALTQPIYKVPPVFIKLTHNKEIITVGIYDFSGESEEKNGGYWNTVLSLRHMKGIIYLTGPEIVRGFDERSTTEKEKTNWNKDLVKVFTLAEQADYQKKYG